MKQESHSAKSSEQILQTECLTLRRQMEGLQALKMQHYESYVFIQDATSGFGIFIENMLEH